MLMEGIPMKPGQKLPLFPDLPQLGQNHSEF